jgi:glycosyltransferase involved in cell wall biosynthesis
MSESKCVIIGPAHPLRGGIAATDEALARAMQEAGYTTEIVSFTLQYPEMLFPGKSQYTTDPAPRDLIITPLINSVNPFSWWKTAKYINALSPDLVIVRFWLPFLGPALGSILRLLDNHSIVVGLTDNVIPHEKRPGDRLFTRYFTYACDKFVTLSAAVKEDLKEFTEKATLFLPHPINDQYGELLNKKEARKTLGWEPDGQYVLFFGLVRKYKGLDLLIEAFGSDYLKDKNIKLVVAGEFYDDPAFYEDRVKELGLGDRVTFINEYIPSADIKLYFSAANLAAQTYRTATQSGITQIAYHFELPMLVTHVGGLPEIVPHEKVGYVTSLEPSDIGKHIARFFDEEKEDAFRAAVKEEKKRFAWSTFVENLIAFVKS